MHAKFNDMVVQQQAMVGMPLDALRGGGGSWTIRATDGDHALRIELRHEQHGTGDVVPDERVTVTVTVLQSEDAD